MNYLRNDGQKSTVLLKPTNWRGRKISGLVGPGLDEFSLIVIEKGGKNFGMHRLVQLATRM